MKQSKSLLISLPWADYCFPSIKVGLLAAYCRSKGFDTTALHAHLDVALELGLDNYVEHIDITGEAISCALLFPERKDFILRRLKRGSQKALKSFERAMRKFYASVAWNEYDLVGFTVDYRQLFSSLLISRWIKSDYPRVKTVLGGIIIFGEMGMSTLRAFSQIDYCVQGEGEIPLVEILKKIHCEDGRSLFAIPGLIYRHDRKVRANPPTQLHDLKGLPDPDYDHYYNLIDAHRKNTDKDINTFITIESSRGCPHKCAFCSDRLQSRGYRARPSMEVVEQMKRFTKRYQVSHFHFVDLSVRRAETMKLYNAIRDLKRDYDITHYGIRADVNSDLLKTMKDAGANQIQIGIEALSDGLLRKMNKGVSFIQNVQAIKLCEELGIEHYSNIICGFPTETQGDVDDAMRNMDFLSYFRPPSDICDFFLLEGSTVFDRPEAFNVEKGGNDEYINSLLPPSLRRDFRYFVKTHKVKGRRPRYGNFKKRYSRWKADYEAGRKKAPYLLIYQDLSEFLLIEDVLHGRMIRLEDLARRIYLFCDTIKSLDEMIKYFSDVDKSDIITILAELVELKLVFKEGEKYLSLAVHCR